MSKRKLGKVLIHPAKLIKDFTHEKMEVQKQNNILVN